MRSNSAVRYPRTLLVAAVALATAVLTGCSSGSGGPGVASLGGSSSPSGSSGNASDASPLAYSQCMRAHGVPDYPDPNAQGQVRIESHPGSDLDPNSPTFKAAQQACQSLQPTPPAAQQQRNYQALLKFSSCMRAHGINDFPDPQPDGRMQISAAPGSDLNPNSSTFQAAQRACQKYQPGFGKFGGPASNGGGK